MTQTLVEALGTLGHAKSLVERRFSRTVAEVGSFSFRKLASAAWLPVRLLTTLVRFRPHVVIFFATTNTFSFLSDWTLSELLRPFPSRTVLYLHTVGYTRLAERGRIWSWLVKRLLTSADTVVTLGPSLAFDLEKWIEKSRIVCIPNTASEPTQVTDNDAPVKPTVLYLSNLIPEKGADVFVDAAVALSDEFPAAAFILAGAPVDENFTGTLIAKVASCPSLASRFDFLGAVTDPAEKWALLRKSDVLAFTSKLFEAQPLTILEALAVGTPVVAFAVGGVRDILRDGVDGYLVPPGDLGAFVSALRRLLIELLGTGPRRSAIEAGYRERFSQASYEKAWAQVIAS